MALRFFDGFDHYATAQIAKKWTIDNGNAVIGATGRNSTSGMRLNNTGALVSMTLDAQATWIVGFAFKTNALSDYGTGLLRLIDGTTLHVDLRLRATGNMIVTRNGTTLATTTTAFSAGVYYYIELKITIHDTAGVVEMQVNGSPETLTFSTGTSTNQDTRNGGNATANVIELRGNGSQTDFDDLYICDGTGSSPYEDFLGDCRAESIFPNGNGNSSVLVGSDGNSTDNYLLVDETTPNTADYVESSTPGDKDTYAYGNLTATSGTVYGVAVRPYAAKTDAGARSIVTVARLSGTEVDSAALTLTTTEQYHKEVPRVAKPGGGTWAVSDVNSSEFGVKVNA